MAEPAKRKRGRPPLLPHKEYERHRDYYVEVEVVRHEKLGITGRARKAAEACRLLAKRGGLVWILGGASPRVLSGLKKLPKRLRNKGRHYTIQRAGRKLQLQHEENGNAYVLQLAQHAKSIESRYREALVFARENPDVKAVWDDEVCERCRLPRVLMPGRPFGETRHFVLASLVKGTQQ